MVKQLIQFIQNSPTSFHTVHNIKVRLDSAGFRQLATPILEDSKDLCGGKFYIIRNDSAIIAFEIPAEAPKRFLITASHTDSPCFRLKDHPSLQGAYHRLSVERYGGAINATWLDRPLSIAGRVVFRTGDGIRSELVDMKRDAAVIPNVAIHLNTELNSNPKYDLAKDFYPLYSVSSREEERSVNQGLEHEIADLLGIESENILAQDLFVYNNQPGTVWGAHHEFLSAPRLDDLACVFTTLEAFLSVENTDSIRMFCAFDNEEIGSGTVAGAESDLMEQTLEEICKALGLRRNATLRQSMMLSCDNAHALHPNHPELSDANEAPLLNGGPVIKHSPRYTTNGLSAGVVAELGHREDIPVQHYSNRADKAGGSTLGNIAITKTGMLAADIGIAQLAMHSAFETCGARDIEHFASLVKAFYEVNLDVTENQIRF